MIHYLQLLNWVGKGNSDMIKSQGLVLRFSSACSLEMHNNVGSGSLGVMHVRPQAKR